MDCESNSNQKKKIPNGIEIEDREDKNNKEEREGKTDSNGKKVIEPGSITTSPINSGKKLTMRDFEVISELGRGAYAKVVLARYLLTNKKIAIKILDKHFINKLSKSHEALIEREMLSNLNHPNIIKLLSTFQDKEKLYFVLEYAPNRDLATFIRSQGVLSYEVGKFYAAEIVNVIEYLHSKKIAHRDLKPENMILDSQMHIKIIDFSTAIIDGMYFDRKEMKFKSNDNFENGGESKDAEENGMKQPFNFAELIYKNHLIGTAEYASPEMLNNNITSHLTTDLWALGCIIYKFFHGKTPFKGNNEMIIFDNILNMNYSISQDLPESVQDIITQLLIENPEERLGTGALGSRNDMESLKKHDFFKGIDFEHLKHQSPPVKINYLNSKDKFKSSDNVVNFLSPKSNNLSDISEFTIPSFLQHQHSSNLMDSPVIKLKTSSSFNILKQISLCDYSFEAFCDFQDVDVIDDYMQMREEIEEEERKLNKVEELVQEGVLKKKAWIVYYTRKLKLYSSGRLEVWEIGKKNDLILTLFVTKKFRVAVEEKEGVFDLIGNDKVHRFKTTEKEMKKWIKNLEKFTKVF